MLSIQKTDSGKVVWGLLALLLLLSAGLVYHRLSEAPLEEREREVREKTLHLPVATPALSPARSPALSPARSPALSPARAPAHSAHLNPPNPLVVSAPAELLVLPAFDVKAAMGRAEKVAEQRGGYRFAEARPVALTPSTAGRWGRLADGLQVWSLALKSPGADSLNLAFSEFHLPPGASLHLFPVSAAGQREKGGPVFTARDNDAHGQLWTPLILGDRLGLELVVPEMLRAAVRLRLASVQHGFRSIYKSSAGKIGGDTSGACNVDVVCGAADLAFGHLIDAARLQIQSVGAYTLNGEDICSGALINNTDGDQRPLFLTADHCGVTAANAASVVMYWNFQNSTCRTPGSAASGGVADGSLATFNTGATFRSEYAPSDFTLIELDDPVHPDAQAYFSGWDRSGGVITMATGIHHPAVAEKRISFDYDVVQVTDYDSTVVSGGGTHLRSSIGTRGRPKGAVAARRSSIRIYASSVSCMAVMRPAATIVLTGMGGCLPRGRVGGHPAAV